MYTRIVRDFVAMIEGYGPKGFACTTAAEFDRLSAEEDAIASVRECLLEALRSFERKSAPQVDDKFSSP